MPLNAVWKERMTCFMVRDTLSWLVHCKVFRTNDHFRRKHISDVSEIACTCAIITCKYRFVLFLLLWWFENVSVELGPLTGVGHELIWSSGGMIFKRKTEWLGQKFVSVTLTVDLPLVVSGFLRRLTAWATTRIYLFAVVGLSQL